MENRHCILLVEDDPFQRRLLTDELSAQGCFVVAAENGLEALNFLDSISIDAVLTDIFMPEIDGIELIRSLRKRAPNMPVFAFSGGMKDCFNTIDSIDWLELAKRLGADEVFTKPVDVAAFITKMERRCRSRTEISV